MKVAWLADVKQEPVVSFLNVLNNVPSRILILTVDADVDLRGDKVQTICAALMIGGSRKD